MKKIIVFGILFSLLAASAFAQLNVGGYVQSFWFPYRLTVPQEGDALHTTAVQTSWGEPDISAGVNFDAWSEWGGFHLGIGLANGAKNEVASAFSATGGGWVWVKPFNFIPYMDSFTIYLGNPNNSTLMGKIGGSDFATYVLNKTWALRQYDDARYRIEIQDPAYNIFTKMNPYSWGNADNPTNNLYWPQIAAAAMFTWEPIERLHINAFVAPEQLAGLGWDSTLNGGLGGAATESATGEQKLGDDDISQDFYDVNEVYRKIQVGAGYAIPGIGFARAQFIGIRNVFEIAFQLTALRDIVIDTGFKIPFEGADKEDRHTYKKKKDFQASIAATYKYYDFRMMGRVDTAFAGSNSDIKAGDPLVHGLNMVVYIVPSYTIGIGTVGADFGFEYEQKDDINGFEQDAMQAGMALWFSRDLGNAKFKTGIVTRFPLEWGEINNQSYWNGSKTAPFDFMIPVYLSVGF